MTDYYLRLKVVAATGFGQGYESCAFSGSSGIVANLFKTCFKAGRRMGLLSPLV